VATEHRLRVIVHVNEVHHVITVNRVAHNLREDEDRLADVANELEIEDGVTWVYGIGEYGIVAFTDFGIENLIELIKCTKSVISQNDQPGGPRRMLTPR
jgi:hypothetical protein